MAKVTLTTLTTPATVTMRDGAGRTVSVPIAGQSFSIAEAGGVTTLVSVVAPAVVPPPAATETLLLAGSLNTITMADGRTLAITSAGVIQVSGVPLLGGGGWSAVNYVPSIGQVWGRDRASSRWWRWGGSMTRVSWSLPAVPYQPVTVPVVPPVVPPPAIVPSPAWFSIPKDGETIIMADGGKVTRVGGVVMLNGAKMGFSGSVTAVFKDAAERIWQQSTEGGGGCWCWTGITWISGADPRPGSVVVPPIVVVPPVTGASAPRARLLAYLKSLEGKNSLIGQTSHQDNWDFKQVVGSFGFGPAIMFNDPWTDQWANNAPFTGGFLQESLDHAKAGGIVGMSLILPNPADPVEHNPSMGGSNVDPVQLLQPGTALNNALNSLLDRAAPLYQAHKAAGNAVLSRFMMELDGGWFWYGYGNFSHAQQTQLFRYIVNYLRVTKGLDNLLTTFAINGGPGDYEYPGDDVVDIIGIDAYTDDLAAYKGAYDRLTAQAPSKVFALTEFGSGGPTAVNPNYDLNRLKADIGTTLPRTCYADFWTGWRPDEMANSKAAMSDPFWINLSQVRLPAA